MLFPIIKVKDSATNREHIVGTNSHDELEVNEGKYITYYNLQNGEGTGDFGAYRFTGDHCDYRGVTIEFVTFEELKKIYENQLENQLVEDKKQQEILDEILEDWLHEE